MELRRQAVPVHEYRTVAAVRYGTVRESTLALLVDKAARSGWDAGQTLRTAVEPCLSFPVSVEARTQLCGRSG